MQLLTGSQSKFLRGLAHSLKPVVFVGRKGVNPDVLNSIREALATHELIKVRFVDVQDRRRVAEAAAEIQQQTGSFLAGAIGRIAIFYRPQPDPEKRKIRLPGNPSGNF
jgi:RNA-binding protein